MMGGTLSLLSWNEMNGRPCMIDTIDSSPKRMRDLIQVIRRIAGSDAYPSNIRQ